jgi:hypothetical protein
MINAVLNATITASLIAFVVYFAIAAVAFTHDRFVYRQPAAVVADIDFGTDEIMDKFLIGFPALPETTAPIIEEQPLAQMTWRELELVAKVRGVKNRRNLKKFELVEAITNLT